MTRNDRRNNRLFSMGHVIFKPRDDRSVIARSVYLSLGAFSSVTPFDSNGIQYRSGKSGIWKS